MFAESQNKASERDPEYCKNGCETLFLGNLWYRQPISKMCVVIGIVCPRSMGNNYLFFPKQLYCPLLVKEVFLPFSFLPSLFHALARIHVGTVSYWAIKPLSAISYRMIGSTQKVVPVFTSRSLPDISYRPVYFKILALLRFLLRCACIVNNG